MRKFTLISVFVLVSMAVSFSAFACSGAGANKHIGLVTSVDNQRSTFTIKDAETQMPITFIANEEILKGLKDYNGRVMVSYEEDVGGDLKALGVSF